MEVIAGGAASDDGTELCAVSGKRYPRREMIQFEGKWISAEHRDAFFQRMREGVVQPGHLVYAGFWLRFLAKFLDGIIINVMCMVVNMLLAVLLLVAVAVAALVDPRLLELTPGDVHVETASPLTFGTTIFTPADRIKHPATTHVAREVKVREFLDLFVKRLAGAPRR